MPIVSGPYTATWNALAVGQTEAGFGERYNYQGRPISFDSVGETEVDVILSKLVMTVDFVVQEYDAAALATMRWPWHATSGQMPVFGTSMWGLAQPLILTSCTTGVNPATKTYIKAILAPGFDIDVPLSHRERFVPIRMLILPVQYDAMGYATPSMPTGCNDIVYHTETQWP